MNFFLFNIAIPVSSVLAVFLSTSDDPGVRAWASVCGLLGQPLWMVTSWRTRSWGVFVTSIFFMVIWAKDFAKYWF